MNGVGAEVGLVYDSDGEVSVGDFLRTGTGRSYVVTSARQGGRPNPPYALRYRLRAVVIHRREVPADAVVHRVMWWPRARRPSRAR